MRRFRPACRDSDSVDGIKKRLFINLCAAAAAAFLLSPTARADSYNWTNFNPTGDWDAIFPGPLSALGDWFDNTANSYAIQVPGAADDVTFGSVSYTPVVGVNMNGPHSVNSITFDTPSAFTINNSGGLNTALTLISGSLIQTVNDSGAQTIGVPVVMGALANWSLNGSGTIVLSQALSSNNARLGLITTGTGNLTSQGQNTYQGNTTVSGSGTVLLTGSIGVAINGTNALNLIVDSQQGSNFIRG